MRGEAVSVWLPASQQAYRRAEELCDRTIRQIPDGKEKGKDVSSARRNDAVTAQFSLWLRAAQLQADGYRELGDTEQAGSGQATDEEKRMLAYTLVNSYRDDDEGYDIPLTTYTSKRYDHKKTMKDMKKMPGPFPWPDSFLCNRKWHENVFRYAQKYGRPADRLQR